MLKKHLRNSRPKHAAMKISIDGSIGVGKTTILERLSEELGVDACLEPVGEWEPYLERFYENPQRWSLCFNLKVLGCFSRPSHAALYERSPVSCRKVFTELGYKNKHMSDLEMDAFDEIYEKIGWSPDVVIYLRCSPEECMRRMLRRGRRSEQIVSLAYLEQLHEAYESLASSSPKVVTVDAARPADQVYDDVRRVVCGLLYPPTQLLDSK